LNARQVLFETLFETTQGNDNRNDKLEALQAVRDLARINSLNTTIECNYDLAVSSMHSGFSPVGKPGNQRYNRHPPAGAETLKRAGKQKTPA